MRHGIGWRELHASRSGGGGGPRRGGACFATPRGARGTALARIVFRDPERAMRVVLDALPDQKRFDQMLAPVFASPAGLMATFGELAGAKGLLVPRAERHARAAAERTAASFVAEVREWQAHHAGAVRLAIEAEREARAAAATRCRVCRRRPSRRSSRS